ncbi:ABC transporter ATP-binding protein [Nocardioides sp. ChNu-153]|uniref:metal ABC transporter ATP-binding protein n=1 Tax=Nocardioides sp. ChNu-153 TaxID=2779364 RepID=UPI002655BC33|nr:ABC transporter ATP-binding protein [Nocardioides sp. ChNu-153]MDN7120762.1 ABC transporter ATP-binding protein [Nocardioides sp. ChNu-153]
MSRRPGTPEVTAPVVDVADVTVAIEGRAVVRDVSLTITAGEFVVLMGANGSGKSTLVRAMTGLRPVAAGEVRLFGTPLARFRRRDRIGYVPQRAGASGGVPASVAEVVASGRISRRGPFRPSGAADRRAVAEALDVVGLADRAQETVTALSGGQQQRVLIARALAAEPEVLFLDEPTAGVDLPHQQALVATLGRLSERGVTVVLVAHEIGVVAPLIDRCLVMRQGRLVYDGLPLSEADVHRAGAPAGVPLVVPGLHTHVGDHAHDHGHQHEHGHHHDHAHERAPHECPPGHSDVVPDIAGPFDRTYDRRGGQEGSAS